MKKINAVDVIELLRSEFGKARSLNELTGKNDFTLFSFTCSMYLTDSKELRQEIMFRLTGEFVPASKCLLPLVEAELMQSFKQTSLF